MPAPSSFPVTTTLVLLLAIASKVTDVTAVNKVIDEPRCDATKAVSIRYASTTGRLYVEAATPGTRGGCVTLTDIFNSQGGGGPLYPVEPSTGARVNASTGTWLLTEDLYVEDGIKLKVSPGNL